MQLTYRGQAYQVSHTSIATAVSQETAVFLGQRYTRKQFNVEQRQVPAALTYRGVHYVH